MMEFMAEPDPLLEALRTLTGRPDADFRDGQRQAISALVDDRGRVLQNTPLKVAAKTGTLNFVSGLGGYVATQGGRDLAFAIFVADTDQRDRIARADRETPRGARSWNGKAKRLQQALIERWAAAYGG